MTVEGTSPSDVSAPIVRNRSAYSPGEVGYVDLLVADDLSGVDPRSGCWVVESEESDSNTTYCLNPETLDTNRFLHRRSWRPATYES
ncbi:MAG: hypothetical protein H6729_05180 [Deltaproteobacteria bacterium]|nr:hypothetical protein [Deltaproteobacteria bacterium]